MSQNQDLKWWEKLGQAFTATGGGANSPITGTTNVRPVYTPPTDFARDAEDVALNLAATGGRTVTPTNFNQDGSTPRENLEGFYFMNAEGDIGVDAQGQEVRFDSVAESTTTGRPIVPGTSNVTPTGVRYDTRPGAVGGTDGSAPKEGDVRRDEQGRILEFRNGQWQVAQTGTTREFITQDPNAMAEVPGADANQPIDKYMESLGVNSLAGQAYQEALARRLASIEEQRLSAGQTYQSMYEQARMSQAARRGMSDVSGMTGGMEQQMGSRMSAAEIGALGQIGMGREATMRGFEQAELAAPMEAFQEGRAIDEYEIAKQELERSRTMQDTEMQRAETLFQQAQSGWMQNADGTWTNIDKETQNSISLQAINAQQRAETLGEMQYWQAVLADPTQIGLHESARSALGALQTRYGELLTNSSVITGRPQEATSPEITPTGEPTPEPTPQPGLTVDFTQGTVQQNAVPFITPKIAALGITPETSLPNFAAGIRTNEDLAEVVYNLAGNKAAEGYTFDAEVAMLNRAIKEPNTLTEAEFNQLREAGAYKGSTEYLKASFGINRSVTGAGTSVWTFPKNEITTGFLQYLASTGEMTQDEIANSIQDNGSFKTNKNLESTFKSWNTQGRPTRKPTIHTGGNAPENPQPGDIWQTPYGKATFKDGRWQ